MLNITQDPNASAFSEKQSVQSKNIYSQNADFKQLQFPPDFVR